MNIPIKTPQEIQKMRAAGALASKVLEFIEPHVLAGVSTLELDTLCHDYITKHGAIPAPLNYKGFPKSICTSINHVVCHGIPSKEKVLKKGDILNIDVTVIVDGYHGDTSCMYAVGEISSANSRLCATTQLCMYEAIDLVAPGVQLGDLGACIQQRAESEHYGVVREFTGHGIGASFHEEPMVLHYGKKGTGVTLSEGMCFTIEPMINQGTHRVKILGDGWTAITQDRRNSAQYEHTILVTATGYEILTLRSEEAHLIKNGRLDLSSLQAF